MENRTHSLAILLSGTAVQIVVVILPVIISDFSETMTNGVITFSSAHSVYAFLVTGSLILFGIFSIVSGWRHFYGLAFHRLMLLIFGCTFISASFFGHISISGLAGIDLHLIEIHRYFAGLAIISFSTLTISTAVVLSENPERMLSFIAGTTVIVSTLLQCESHAFAGLWQRIIILIIIGWMIYINRYSELKDNN